MSEIPDEPSSIGVGRRASSRFYLMEKKLKFSSADEFVMSMLDLISKLQLDKVSILTLGKYGRLPELPKTFEGSAVSDEKVFEAVGIRDDMKKTFDSEEERQKKLNYEEKH